MNINYKLKFKIMDINLQQILFESNRNDNSYNEKVTFIELLLRPFGKKYHKSDMRQAYLAGKEIGFEMAYYLGSPKGQELQLRGNVDKDPDPDHVKFYDKFLDLCNEYNVSIQYHPSYGMTLTQLRKPEPRIKCFVDENGKIDYEVDYEVDKNFIAPRLI